MGWRRFVTFLGFAVSLLIPGCGGTDTGAMATEEETTDSCVSVEATYSSIQNHVLARSCTSCHGSQGNVSLESYSQVVSGTNSAGNRVVTPFDPSNSRLYVTVNTGTMPLGGPALCNAKIQAIRTWIENGAAND